MDFAVKRPFRTLVERVHDVLSKLLSFTIASIKLFSGTKATDRLAATGGCCSKAAVIYTSGAHP